MGLDMYLSRAKRLGNATVREITAIDSYLDWEIKGKDKDIAFNDWAYFKECDVRKDLLDLYRPYFTEHGTYYKYRTIIDVVGYWRKVNAIHNWFVENVQGGNDDCGVYEVSKGDLITLKNTVKEVLDNFEMTKGKIKVSTSCDKDGNWVDKYEDGMVATEETIQIADELLPTSSGFFFGSTDYNEWYKKDLEETLTIIDKVLDTTDWNTEVVSYQASW